jgi:hypothetical protein
VQSLAAHACHPGQHGVVLGWTGCDWLPGAGMVVGLRCPAVQRVGSRERLAVRPDPDGKRLTAPGSILFGEQLPARLVHDFLGDPGEVAEPLPISAAISTPASSSEPSRSMCTR